MMQHVSEEQLALYAGGDLPEVENAAVARHVENCGECQRVIGEYREAQGFVAASLKDPELDDLVQVRESVTARLKRRDGERRWAWCLAGAAAVVVLFLLALSMRDGTAVNRRADPVMVAQGAPRRKSEVARVSQTPQKSAAMASLRRPQSHRAGFRTVKLITGAHNAAAIKMTTDDPNIVILWQMNEGTDNE